MAGVALSSLRVTAEMDASKYAAGMAVKTAADDKAIASANALGAALAQSDAGLAKMVPGVATLSRQFIGGYQAGQQFEQAVRRVGNAVDRGMDLERAGTLLDLIYRKFGLTADATQLTAQGYVKLVPLVNELNAYYDRQATVLQRVADAQASLARQSQIQSVVNKYAGVKDVNAMAGSAESSAQVFMPLLEARAEQIGKAFGESLDEAMIAGVAKSARDSAAVFEAELTRLDEIAELHAQQIGQNFQADLNSRMRIGAPPKSAKDSASVFMNAEQEAKALETLKEKYIPIAMAERLHRTELAEINKLLSTGSINQKQYDVALAGTNARFKEANAAAASAAGGINHAAGMAAIGNTQFMALTAAIRHSIDAMIAGRPPLQAIGMEIGNLSYGLSGGFFNSLKALGAGILSFITPLTVTITAVVTAIGTAAYALYSYASAQHEVAMSLLGIGRASGMTIRAVNDLAKEVSNSTSLSISEARELASALAATGKVSKETIGEVAKLGYSVAKAFGTDASGAAKMLADAMVNPVRGAEQLNEKFGFLDAATMRTIENLKAQNRLMEAQKVLIDGIKSGQEAVSETISSASKFWTALGNAISNGITNLGEFLSKTTGIGYMQGLDEKIEKSVKKIESLRKQIRIEETGTFGLKVIADNLKKQLAEEEQALEGARAKWKSYHDQVEEAIRKRDSFNRSQSIDQVLPELKQLQTLQNEAMAAALTKKAIDMTGGRSSPLLKELPQTYDEVAKGAQVAAEKVDKFKNSIEQQNAATEISIRYLDARGIEDRRAQAEAAKRLELEAQGRAGTVEGMRAIREAGILAAGGQTALDAAERERIQTLGPLASVIELVKIKTLELNEADRKRLGITQEQRVALEALARIQAENQRTQERTQVGLAREAELRRQVANDLESLTRRGLLNPNDAREWGDAQVYAAKKLEQLRNQAELARAPLEGLKRLEQETGSLRVQLDQFGTTSINALGSSLLDLATGAKTAKEAFRDFGMAVVRAILDMIIKMTILMPIAMAMQTILSAFLPTGMAMPTTGLDGLPALRHGGGIVGEAGGGFRRVNMANFYGASRYHTGGIVGDEVPIIARRGEGVFTQAQMQAMGSSGAVSVAMGGVHIEVHGNMDDKALQEVKAELAQFKRDQPGLIVNTVKQARSRRII